MSDDSITLEISAKDIGLALAMKNGKFVIALGGEVLYSKSDLIDIGSRLQKISDHKNNRLSESETGWNNGIAHLINEL